MPDFYVKPRGVRATEEVIDRKELERLRWLARRGEDYEAAAKSMRNVHADMVERRREHPDDRYIAGWLAAIREFSERVVRGGGDE